VLHRKLADVTAKEFQKLVTEDKSDFLDRFLALLHEKHMDYCVIGGLAVNAYTEPVVTLDCDVVVVASRIGELETELRQQCRVERFSHSLNLTDPRSKVRIQIQLDEQLQKFLPRKRKAMVLEREMFVASPEDLIASKIDAYHEPKRRRTKREKDRLDILRLIEAQPHLEQLVPVDLQREFNI
jgi:hypothetical protein